MLNEFGNTVFSTSHLIQIIDSNQLTHKEVEELYTKIKIKLHFTSFK